MAISTIGNAYASNLYGSEKRLATDKKSTVSRTKGERVELSGNSEQATVETLKKIVKKSPDVRVPLVKELEAKIATNDYPLESSLSEALKKMIQARIFNL